jgi:hypothetical protein
MREVYLGATLSPQATQRQKEAFPLGRGVRARSLRIAHGRGARAQETSIGSS